MLKSLAACCPLLLFPVVVKNKVDQFHGAYGGDRVFVHQLLSPVGIKYYGEIVETLYHAL
jgi:hypothetical protein